MTMPAFDTLAEPAAVETVVVTRQPIMDATNRLIGYDLLVHGAEWGDENADPAARRDSVQRTLMHVFVDLGIERLASAFG